MRKIAMYGKGGIGKSITCQNLVAGLAVEQLGAYSEAGETCASG